MYFASCRRLVVCVVVGAVAATLARDARAQTVWTGLTHSFTKPNTELINLPENQDRITDNVWITRYVNGGIFNIRTESIYDPESPLDTRWATDLNNPGATIAASNWAALTFDSWITAYGGPQSMGLPARLLSRNAVVHLVSDDIYLDLRFTSWTSSAGGGGFSYLRSAAAVPEPGTAGLALTGIAVVTSRVRRRRRC